MQKIETEHDVSEATHVENQANDFSQNGGHQPS